MCVSVVFVLVGRNTPKIKDLPQVFYDMHVYMDYSLVLRCIKLRQSAYLKCKIHDLLKVHVFDTLIGCLGVNERNIVASPSLTLFLQAR